MLGAACTLGGEPNAYWRWWVGVELPTPMKERVGELPTPPLKKVGEMSPRIPPMEKVGEPPPPRIPPTEKVGEPPPPRTPLTEKVGEPPPPPPPPRPPPPPPSPERDGVTLTQRPTPPPTNPARMDDMEAGGCLTLATSMSRGPSSSRGRFEPRASNRATKRELSMLLACIEIETK